MRRLFYTLGVVFAVLILIAGGLVGFAFYRRNAMDTESKAYVDQAVTDVGRTWDKSELLKRASPELLKRASADQIANLFQQLKSLGRLVHYDGSKGDAMMTFWIGKQTTTRAHYEAKATFENGPAHFRVDVSKLHGQWMIDGFFVNYNRTPVSAQIKPI